jgi:hypothetical protein
MFENNWEHVYSEPIPIILPSYTFLGLSLEFKYKILERNDVECILQHKK